MHENNRGIKSDLRNRRPTAMGVRITKQIPSLLDQDDTICSWLTIGRSETKLNKEIVIKTAYKVV